MGKRREESAASMLSRSIALTTLPRRAKHKILPRRTKHALLCDDLCDDLAWKGLTCPSLRRSSSPRAFFVTILPPRILYALRFVEAFKNVYFNNDLNNSPLAVFRLRTWRPF